MFFENSGRPVAAIVSQCATLSSLLFATTLRDCRILRHGAATSRLASLG